MVFPWEEPTSADESVSNEFTRHRKAGETLEFIRKDYGAAAAAYRLALASARQPSESAEARLLLARASAKAGNPAAAFDQYRALLNAPAEARDDQRVGFRFYAADRLLAAAPDADDVRTFLRNQIQGDGRLTLPELYMIRSLLGPSVDLQTGRKTAERISEMMQAGALAKDYRRVRAEIESGAASDGSAWVSHGKEPWLITMTSPQLPLPALVIAVSSTVVVPPGVKLLSRPATGLALVDALGDGFQDSMSNGWTAGFPRRCGRVFRSESG